MWARWATLHGVPRAFLVMRAHRGEPLARLLLGRIDRWERLQLFEQLRAVGPLVRTPAAWVTADHEVCRMILRDNRFGVSAPSGIGLPGPLQALARHADPGLPNPVEPPSMLMVNPPDHTRFRRLVARSFTPRSIGTLDTLIGDVTAELLDGLEGRHNVDLITDYAAQLPAAIITEILGLPSNDRHRILGWGNSGATLLDIGITWRTFHAAVSDLHDIDSYLTDHFARLHIAGGDGTPFSDMALKGELTDRELKANATLLVGAGVETTVNLIGNGVTALLQHRDQLALLHDDPTLWPSAIEEILRFDSPIQMTPRMALCDMEIAGTKLQEGDGVVLLLGGANRDPRVFPYPDRFDITRPNTRDHLAFSSGIHACVGAALARIEGATALRELFTRFPELHLEAPPEPRRLVTLQGYRRLPVRLHDATHASSRTAL
ncbi:putative cytochrome P450 [Mycolicibacterium cyprinidarum]|uniref:Cytochrome P450 n=1 Tax=Mycolicibacterium cyprinidarum TaxID=2860311 RepID=A0ABQ4V3X8_9MYCO|nr:putative cytochrome P450 [Mycolicibacterium sp. NGTWSNA01]GJF20243.1 putative cytochrome P450 [Mycolicibacterium sp. NGTWS0302]